tara:strand:+ start:11760 stop:12065 length:306 start_codon:yes stop_codon:yes gene_type:complete
MDLSQDEWMAKLKEVKNHIILDVRTSEEFKEVRIPKSILLDISSPIDFMKGLEPMDKEKVYLVYCRSGNRSSRACAVMTSMGFNKTFNLVGGILEWKGLIK